MAQGILGIFLREPLLDWQREARVLQGVRRSKDGSPPQESGVGAADAHISQKARSPEDTHVHSCQISALVALECMMALLSPVVRIM